jgi:hypothetical protein
MWTAALDADDGDVFGNDVEDRSSAPAVSFEGCGQGAGTLRLP